MENFSILPNFFAIFFNFEQNNDKSLLNCIEFDTFAQLKRDITPIYII